ncbi:conserved hypothetical protein [Anaeromyxobacter sp. K]|uniref:hypothetical protein n=1 Tax=Anaeromyxobacter sp. (strain K) TaxID=447217 RepID=UPI00015F9AB2|nr:hypothetical protein [Anaeromyxobacter sp. K]ACG74660.1 conserved hypothetical protein [Anaeromyxobacter sp. K]
MPRSAEPPAPPPARPPPFSPGSRAARRRARAAKVGAPYLVPLALAAAAALLLWRYWDRIAGADLAISAASPETQVREALRHQERAHLNDVYGFKSGGTAELVPVRFAEVAVQVDGDRASVLAIVEADGRVTWRDEHAEVSYVGREAFAMTRCSIALWCGDGQQFAGLRGVLTALFRREDAWNAGDAAALERLVAEGHAGDPAALGARLRAELAAAAGGRVRISAWQIRVERDRAEVGEDYELVREGRAAERRRARYVLAREGERWRFVDGL